MGGGRAAYPCHASPISLLLILQALLLSSLPLVVSGDTLLVLAIVMSSSASTTTTSPERRPRTFLITGSTDGIGRHTSRRLAIDGHALLVHGRREPPAVSSLIRELTELGASRVAYVRADLGDLDQVANMASDVISTLRSWQSSLSSTGEEGDDDVATDPNTTPALDCLINNAGVFDPTPRISTQGYDMTMAVNVLAPFVLTRLLLPCLVRGNEPRIITTSSVSQSRTLPNLNSLFEPSLPYSAHSSYSHSKLGDLLFTVQLAKVLSSYAPKEEDLPLRSSHLLDNLRRIQCLTMDPGTVNTKMLLAGWGPCGISVNDANNTYKLATMAEYAHGASGAKSGSYHFGWGMSRDAHDGTKLVDFWNMMSDCTDISYDDLSRDCF